MQKISFNLVSTSLSTFPESFNVLPIGLVVHEMLQIQGTPPQLFWDLVKIFTEGENFSINFAKFAEI
jgi:hypothetical protein